MVATLRAPAYFGEGGLLLGQPRAATVVAVGDAVCYRLDKKGFDAIIQGATLPEPVLVATAPA